MASADGSIAVADRAERQLEALRRQVTREIERLLLRLDTERGSSSLQSDQAALETLSRVRLQITAALNEATRGVLGLGVDGVDRAAIASLKGYQSILPADFTPDSTAILARVRAGTLDEIPAAFAKGADAIGIAMRAGVTSAAPLDSVIEAVSNSVSTSFSRAQSAVDTAIVAAGRSGLVEAARVAQQGIRMTEDRIVYLYLGSEDGKTRPFCKAHLGQCYSLGALDGEDNGQGLRPTSVFLGGYNCRHSLAPMLLSEAKARGLRVTI